MSVTFFLIIFNSDVISQKEEMLMYLFFNLTAAVYKLFATEIY